VIPRSRNTGNTGSYEVPAGPRLLEITREELMNSDQLQGKWKQIKGIRQGALGQVDG
jgi:hypothetical protein